jgi:hypothetical protein
MTGLPGNKPILIFQIHITIGCNRIVALHRLPTTVSIAQIDPP